MAAGHRSPTSSRLLLPFETSEGGELIEDVVDEPDQIVSAVGRRMDSEMHQLDAGVAECRNNRLARRFLVDRLESEVERLELAVVSACAREEDGESAFVKDLCDAELPQAQSRERSATEQSRGRPFSVDHRTAEVDEFEPRFKNEELVYCSELPPC
ncbi:hypothetical protein JCM8202_005059 [Rhodotorula sphaerocarpa]